MSAGQSGLMAFSSALLPITWTLPQSGQTHTGKGVPQYRSRVTAQSMTFSTKLPMRPSRMVSGIQLTLLVNRTSLSFTAVMRMNHSSRA